MKLFFGRAMTLPEELLLKKKTVYIQIYMFMYSQEPKVTCADPEGGQGVHPPPLKITKI